MHLALIFEKGLYLMDKAESFDCYQKFYMYFRYENELFSRHCIVPFNWMVNEVEKYLKYVFYKPSFNLLRYTQENVYLLSKEHLTSNEIGDNTIGLYWKEGIQWNTSMQLQGKKLEVIFISDSFYSEKKLLKTLEVIYPTVKNIVNTYQIDCWIKNSN